MSRSEAPISRSSDDFASPRASTYNRILRMTSNILLPVAAPRRRPRLWRFLALTVLLLLFVVAAGIAWLINVARSALPDLDGALPVSGISAPVSVNRDSHGVPTIEAATLDDLFFAQGYVTAQDRLFQMDLMRRAAAGDLSEVIGDVALKHDRQQRILGIRATAEKEIRALSPADRQHFDAYAGRVNAFINTHQH